MTPQPYPEFCSRLLIPGNVGPSCSRFHRILEVDAGSLTRREAAGPRKSRWLLDHIEFRRPPVRGNTVARDNMRGAWSAGRHPGANRALLSVGHPHGCSARSSRQQDAPKSAGFPAATTQGPFHSLACRDARRAPPPSAAAFLNMPTRWLPEEWLLPVAAAASVSSGAYDWTFVPQHQQVMAPSASSWRAFSLRALRAVAVPLADEVLPSWPLVSRSPAVTRGPQSETFTGCDPPSSALAGRHRRSRMCSPSRRPRR